MKNIYKILIITGIFLISLLIVILVSNITYVLKYKNVEYFKMGNDQIPSIYKVIGERKLYYYKSSNDTINLKYKNIENVTSDLNNYIDILTNEYNYVYTSPIDFSTNEGKIQISTNSVDNNKIIIIDIKYSIGNYEITITKGKGTLNYK